MTRSKNLFIGIGITIAIIIGVFVAYSQTVKEDQVISNEAVTVRLGYLSIVDGVQVFSAIEKGYFEQEGIKLTTTKFATSNQVAEAVLNGDIDYGAIVSSSVVFSIEDKVPDNFKVLSTIVHPSERPFSAILVRNDSSLTIDDLKGKKIGIFPGSTSLALSKIAFRNLVGDDFEAEYVPMPPNLWLDALSSNQVDAVISYEPSATLGTEMKVVKIIYNGFYEKHVMDSAPTAVSIVTSKFAADNPEVVKKIQRALEKGDTFTSTNEQEARQIATKYIPVSESVALKMNLQDIEVGNKINVKALQDYADILFNAGEFEKHIDVSKLIFN